MNFPICDTRIQFNKGQKADELLATTITNFCYTGYPNPSL